MVATLRTAILFVVAIHSKSRFDQARSIATLQNEICICILDLYYVVSFEAHIQIFSAMEKRSAIWDDIFVKELVGYKLVCCQRTRIESQNRSNNIGTTV